MAGILRRERESWIALMLLLAVAVSAAVLAGCRGDEARAAAHAQAAEEAHEMALATFGAGCFWGVEEAFRQVEGVTDTAVGYMGGTLDSPTYEQVCTGKTGHTEVVQVEYDPVRVSYEDLLDVFFRIHDPTQVNRQGPDIGWQYRSVIFYHTPEQAETAQAVKDELEAAKRFRQPIATTIESARTFWRAEEYHQQYYAKRGGGACPRPY